MAVVLARLISVTGFGLVVLGACTIALPYVLRSERYARVAQALGKSVPPLLQRMRPHYWLGITIAVVTAGHALLPLFGGVTGNVNIFGLSLAVLALCLVLPQVNLGLHPAEPEDHGAHGAAAPALRHHGVPRRVGAGAHRAQQPHPARLAALSAPNTTAAQVGAKVG